MQLNKIKQALDERGMTQTHLATCLGVSKQAVSDLCHNRSQPSLKRLYQIAAVIGCTPARLLASDNPFAPSTD